MKRASLMAWHLMGIISASAAVYEISPRNVTDCNEEFENIAGTLQPGDELILRGGDYSQGCRRALSNLNGTEANPIVIRAANGERPVLTRPDASQNNIEIQNCSHLVIRGLAFRGGDSGVRIMNGVHHLTFEDNEVYETENNALAVNTSGATYDALLLRRNHIHHTGLWTGGSTEGEGMYLGCNNNACRVVNSLIEGNYIHHLRSTSDGGNDGIELKPGGSNNLIRNNVIHETTIGRRYPGIFVYGGGAALNIVEGNVIWNSGEAIQAVSDVIVRNNIIFSSDIGINSSAHSQVATRDNVVLVNNTIHDCGEGLYLRWSGTTGMVLANNAVYTGGEAVDASGLSGAGITVTSNYVSGSLSGVSIDNSRFYAGGNASGAFQDAPARNFWPATGAVLIGAASAAWAPPMDFNERSRSAPFDVGAYETEGSAVNPGWAIQEGFKGIAPAAPAVPERPRRLRGR